MSERPLVSVVFLNKNHAATLPEAFESVLSQTVPDLEVVVADGGSTDGSLELIRSYPRVRLLDGTDRSRSEGVMRAVAGATGKYIAFMTTTDAYLSQDWLETAVGHLEANPDVGLVWGALITKNDKRLVGAFYPPQFTDGRPVPGRQRWFLNWATRGFSHAYISELTYCIHADLYKKLIAEDPAAPELAKIDPILRMHFEFIRQGYLPEYVPVLVGFGRMHDDQGQFLPEAHGWMEVYEDERRKHVARLLAGEVTHVWRAPDGRVLERLSRRRLRWEWTLRRLIDAKPVRSVRRSLRKFATWVLRTV